MSQTVRCVKNFRSTMDYKVGEIQRRMRKGREEKESYDRITSRAKWLEIMDWLHKVKLPPKFEWKENTYHMVWDPTVYKFVKRFDNS